MDFGIAKLVETDQPKEVDTKLTSDGTFLGTPAYMSPEQIKALPGLIDTRTDEAFFTIKLPVGKQLTFKFLDGKGDDPVLTPDRMQWEVWEAPHKSGKLSNQLTVPPSTARRIQVDVRPGPEYPPDSEEYRLRVDEAEDRPDHWSPSGGELPDQ